MAQQINRGGATALPLARAFLAVGGQLLISPDGELEPKPNISRCFMNGNASDARRAFTVSRRMVRRLRDPRFARSVKALVVTDGSQWDNGWFVMRGEASHD
jgi:hypothetical protein